MCSNIYVEGEGNMLSGPKARQRIRVIMRLRDGITNVAVRYTTDIIFHLGPSGESSIIPRQDECKLKNGQEINIKNTGNRGGQLYSEPLVVQGKGTSYEEPRLCRSFPGHRDQRLSMYAKWTYAQGDNI